MESQIPKLTHWMKWALIFLCWTGFALYFTYQIYLSRYLSGQSINWLNPLLTCLTWAYAWFAVTPLILFAAERLPFQRRRPFRSVIVHSLMAVLIFSVNSALYAPLIRLFVGGGAAPKPLLESIRGVILSEMHIGLVVYWLIFGIVQGLNYYLRYRAGEVHAANLETRLVEAQLNALRMQLHPHFLFVRPAGRVHLRVKVPYGPGRGNR